MSDSMENLDPDVPQPQTVLTNYVCDSNASRPPSPAHRHPPLSPPPVAANSATNSATNVATNAQETQFEQGQQEQQEQQEQQQEQQEEQREEKRQESKQWVLPGNVSLSDFVPQEEGPGVCSASQLLLRPGAGLPAERGGGSDQLEERHEYYWMEEYLRVLELPEAGARRAALCELHKNFVHNAWLTGKTIICEASIQEKFRTIHRIGYRNSNERGSEGDSNEGNEGDSNNGGDSNDGGGGNTRRSPVLGTAGGAKYLHNGIFFKFGCDDKDMYRSDHLAAKVAGNDLRSAIALSRFTRVVVPLMCIIDYRGYRLTAMASCPVGRETLVLGSSDAGRTIADADPALHAILADVGRQLHVREHACYDAHCAPVRVPLAVDIEGHRLALRGGRRRYVVLDFARLMPPVSPDPARSRMGPDRDALAYLYRVFRPEFVRARADALSCDAYSPFPRPDEKAENAAVDRATDALVGDLVPRFAAELDDLYERTGGQGDGNGDGNGGGESDSEREDDRRDERGSNRDNGERDEYGEGGGRGGGNGSRGAQLLRGKDLTQKLHQRGINCRYYGLLRSHARHAGVRAAISGPTRVIQADLTTRVTVDFYNYVLGLPLPRRPRTPRFSPGILEDMIDRLFPGALRDDERRAGAMAAGVDLPALFVRVGEFTGVAVSARSLRLLRT